MAADRSCHQQTCGHMARFGKARFGYGPAAIGGPPRAARGEAAARRKAAQVGRAAGDRVDVALARLTVHGRGEQSRRVGMVLVKSFHMRDGQTVRGVLIHFELAA